jgi:type IV pilus assembly protein PilV
MRFPNRHPARRSRGFTLIEALVALLALSIGLLGVAGLQLAGLRSNMSSAWRSQATYLAYDILDRMRANRTNITTYSLAYAAAPATTGVAQADLLAWKANVANTLPAGDTQIRVDGATRNVIVNIRWDDSRGAEAPLEFTMRSTL